MKSNEKNIHVPSALPVKPVVLVGMMGCGKTTIGRALARQLDLPFFDSDSLVEEQQGTTISSIFENKGEAHFRALERDMIADLLRRDSCVIATGGGAVTTPETWEAIHKRAISIWLSADVETILSRVQNDKSRPLLKGEGIRQKVTTLLKARQDLYGRADIHIDTSGKTIEAVVCEINDRLAQTS